MTHKQSRCLVIGVATILLTFSQAGVAAEKFSGDVTVNGTLRAKDVRVAGKSVVTDKQLQQLRDEIQKAMVRKIAEKLRFKSGSPEVRALADQITKHVMREISEKLKFNSGSPEVRQFADEITKSVVQTVGRSTMTKEDLRKELDSSNKSAAAGVKQLQRTVDDLLKKQRDTERAMVFLEREVHQLRRELARKK